MQPSLAGALVCLALLGLGFALRAPLIVPLLASLAFGSTAIVTLGAVGGSSPLIYTVFAGLTVASLLVRSGARGDVAHLFRTTGSAWLALILLTYVLCGALILPRLFAGQVTAFVASRDDGRVAEVMLAPTSGNVTQAGYLMLGALVFLALSVRFLRRADLGAVWRGLFAWAALTAIFGAVDLAGKLAGAGDVLLPIRTASYAIVVETEHGGLFRIAGAHSEASAFGSAAVPALAFSFAAWRMTGSRGALLLWLMLALLILLSTSTTAYVGFAAMVGVLAATLLRALLARRLKAGDLLLGFMVAVGGASIFALVLYNPHALDPVLRLIDESLINKSQSVSAQERGYWNERSLQSIIDTSGLGVGIGSSRASNWPIAVLSQLGLIGALLFGILLLATLRGPGRAGRLSRDRKVLALHESTRAMALAGLVCASLNGGSADPGLLFFVACATTIACRRHLRLEVRAGPPRAVPRRPAEPSWARLPVRLAAR